MQLDRIACDCIFLLLPVAQNGKHDLRTYLAANMQGDFLALHATRRYTIHSDDLIPCAQSRCLSRGSIEHGDDLHTVILESHRHADAAEGALCVLPQLFEHTRRHIDRVRVTQGGDHPLDGTVNELCCIGCVHIAGLNELHHAKETHNIVPVESRHADEPARKKNCEYAADKCRKNTD